MKKIFQFDLWLITAVGILLVIGLVALYSISFQDSIFLSNNFKKQIISGIIGLSLMVFFSFYDYRVLNSYSTKLYFGIILILLAVIFWGTTIRGTTGWVGIGIFHIQPVEVAKLVLIVFLASFFSKKRDQLSIVVRVIASIVLIFLPIFLILKQPDFGSAFIIIGCWGVMLVLNGINKKNLFVLMMLGILVAGSSWAFLKEYQKDRIINFLDPGRDPRGSGYNVIQSMVAVGSGGIMGRGLGHGSQSQLNFLPEKHTDFIFAVIVEELGLVGGIVTFSLFGVVFWRIKETARLARDNFGYLLATGIITMIFFQFLINIGMNIGVMPVAGVPLPFLSYGGSSLVVVLASMGLIQSIYMRRVKESYSA